MTADVEYGAACLRACAPWRTGDTALVEVQVLGLCGDGDVVVRLLRAPWLGEDVYLPAKILIAKEPSDA